MSYHEYQVVKKDGRTYPNNRVFRDFEEANNWRIESDEDIPDMAPHRIESRFIDPLDWQTVYISEV